MPARRQFLAACASLTAAVAGCTDTGSGDATTAPDDGMTAAGGTATESATPTATVAPPAGTTTGDASTGRDATTATPAADALDLREANVTAVSVSARDGGYRFDVTLYHDDDGEDGYANWWQVEALDGTRLGRRDLLHPHGTREFTRSATVAVPEGTTCVVVRGHDETHGSGGRAALVTLDSGATRFVDQGTEPESFADAECP